ncbi:glycosyltransferase family 4 protein [Chitinophagaceae bacterium LWZ2-11]
MTIYINGRFLTQKVTGVNRFGIEICKALQKAGLEFTVIVPVYCNNTYDFNIVRYGKLKSHFWEQISLFWFLKKKRSPLLINFSGLGPLFYKKQIITIHDLSFYHEPKWFSKKYYFFYSRATPIIAKNCLKILTVSEFSKGEIIKWLKVKANKINVVYNAVGSEHYEDLNKKENYILAVSSLDPRKNYKRLIQAFNSKELEYVSLYIVGKDENNFRKDFTTQSRKNVFFLGYVDDKKLHELYVNAIAFIYPSLYEGFGIPPLEAMSKGCPVIVSEIPVLKEICGDAAMFVDPYSVESIKKGILRITIDQELRRSLVGKGYEQIFKYSWEKSAKEIIWLIKNIIEQEQLSNLD